MMLFRQDGPFVPWPGLRYAMHYRYMQSITENVGTWIFSQTGADLRGVPGFLGTLCAPQRVPATLGPEGSWNLLEPSGTLWNPLGPRGKGNHA